MLVVLVLIVDVVLMNEIGDTGSEMGLAGPAESGGDSREGVDPWKFVETCRPGSVGDRGPPSLEGFDSSVMKRRLHSVRDGSYGGGYCDVVNLDSRQFFPEPAVPITRILTVGFALVSFAILLLVVMRWLEVVFEKAKS